MFRAIETQYAGHLFRSRLEARWAAFFDMLEWEWTYEPFDANGYIPDFVIKGRQPVLVEVRPCVTWEQYHDEAEKVRNGIDGLWSGHTVVVGCDPQPCFASRIGAYDWDRVAGVYASGPAGIDIKPLGWTTCVGIEPYNEKSGSVSLRTCNEVAWFNAEDGFTTTPCGHHDGGGHIGPPPTVGQISEWWGYAHQQSRWQPDQSTPMRHSQRALVNLLTDTDSYV